MSETVRVPLKDALAEAKKRYPARGSHAPRSPETRRRMSEAKKAFYARKRAGN